MIEINAIEKLKIFNAFYDFKRAMLDKFMKKYNENPEGYVAIPWEEYSEEFIYNEINRHFVKFSDCRRPEDALDLAILCFFYWMKKRGILVHRDREDEVTEKDLENLKSIRS